MTYCYDIYVRGRLIGAIGDLTAETRSFYVEADSRAEAIGKALLLASSVLEHVTIHTIRQSISVNDVVQAGRKGYREGKLTAQHPDQFQRRCVYSAGDCRCIIGWSFDTETLNIVLKDAFAASMTINAVNRAGHVLIKDSLQGVRELQERHDQWANESRGLGENDPLTIIARDHFLDAIGLNVDGTEVAHG